MKVFFSFSFFSLSFLFIYQIHNNEDSTGLNLLLAFLFTVKLNLVPPTHPFDKTEFVQLMTGMYGMCLWFDVSETLERHAHFMIQNLVSLRMELLK